MIRLKATDRSCLGFPAGRFRVGWLLTLLLAGCSHIAYYGQAVSGQWELLQLRRSLGEVLADPATPPALHRQLAIARRLRDFASRELALPDNGSYRSFADLRRPYVVKNVFAAPPLSLELLEWCFPITGCVGYRGYFDATAAETLASALRERNYDVYLAEVPAYSTLGWFDDPLLNTFVYWPVGRLGELIFHELAHQRLYIPDDTAYNESFATAVARLGVERWLTRYGTPREREIYQAFIGYQEAFLDLVLATRDKLARLYDAPLTDREKHAGKQRLLQELRQNHEILKQQNWNNYSGYDRWFQQDLNNAKLAALNAYTYYVPAFVTLFRRVGEDFEAFYRAAAALAALPPEAREARLRRLLAIAYVDSWRLIPPGPLPKATVAIPLFAGE